MAACCNAPRDGSLLSFNFKVFAEPGDKRRQSIQVESQSCRDPTFCSFLAGHLHGMDVAARRPAEAMILYIICRSCEPPSYRAALVFDRALTLPTGGRVERPAVVHVLLFVGANTAGLVNRASQRRLLVSVGFCKSLLAKITHSHETMKLIRGEEHEQEVIDCVFAGQTTAPHCC